MGIYAVKPKFQKILRPVEDIFVRLKIHPTYINLLGLASSLLTALLILLSPEHNWVLVFIPLTANIRTACNALDGLVARRLKVASKFGEVLNEFIDRISDSVIFISIALLVSTNLILGLFTIVIILLNSYLSILSKAAGGSRQYGGIVGKADRMIYLSVFAILVFIVNDTLWNYFLWFILITTSVTLFQRFLATKKELS